MLWKVVPEHECVNREATDRRLWCREELSDHPVVGGSRNWRHGSDHTLAGSRETWLGLESLDEAAVLKTAQGSG